MRVNTDMHSVLLVLCIEIAMMGKCTDAAEDGDSDFELEPVIQINPLTGPFQHLMLDNISNLSLN